LRPLSAPHAARPRPLCTLAPALAPTSGTARRHKGFCEAGRDLAAPDV